MRRLLAGLLLVLLAAHANAASVCISFDPCIHRNLMGLDLGAVVKGDLIVGSGAGTLVLKNVGANDTILTADSTVAGGVKWATNAAANNTLSNLGTTSINAHLLFQTTLDVGSTTAPPRNLRFYGSGTFGSHSFTLGGTPTGHRNITFPDASLTVARTDATNTFTQTNSATPTRFASSGNPITYQEFYDGTAVRLQLLDTAGSALAFRWIHPSGSTSAAMSFFDRAFVTDNGFGVGAAVLDNNTTLYGKNINTNYNLSVLESTAAAGSAAWRVRNDQGANAYLQLGTRGSSESGTIFGASIANYSEVITNGSSSNGLLLGTITGDPIRIGTDNTQRVVVATNGDLQLGTTPKTFISNTAPTVASGFCTSPNISPANGTAAFTVTIGTACGASTGTLTMPAATTGWVCHFVNVTTPALNTPSQTGGTTTTVTVTNYARTTGLATNWTDSEVLRVMCAGY